MWSKSNENKDKLDPHRCRPGVVRFRLSRSSLTSPNSLAACWAPTLAASKKPFPSDFATRAILTGFFEAANVGAQQAAKELGDVKVIYTGPTTTTAEDEGDFNFC
jgi:ABC-type sugar transport system substrate-binding protein